MQAKRKISMNRKVIKKNNMTVQQSNILLDTNIIYWLTYAAKRSFPTSLSPKQYQTKEYPEIIDTLLSQENNLFYSRFSIPELFHIIAKVESSLDGVEQREIKKWLRKKGRTIVSSEMEKVLEELNSLSSILNHRCNQLSPNDFITLYNQVFLDGYDLFIVHDMHNAGLDHIVTDDIDFISVDSLNVITANANC